MTDLVGRTTRGVFRDLMTDSTVGPINTAFHDEGFAPDPDSRYEDSSVRRRTTQSYLDAVDWTDPRQVSRFLRVAERLLNGWEPQCLSHFHQSLRRDGYQVDEQTGHITPVGPQLSIESIARLADPSAIGEGFERIRRAISDDPALAVGSAKELIESTAKVVLTERGQPFDDKSDLPKLARAAQLSLGLDPLDRVRTRRQRRRQTHPRRCHNHRQRTRRAAQPRTGHRTRSGNRTRRSRQPARTPRGQCGAHLVPADARHPRRPRSALAQRSLISRGQTRITKTTRFVPLLSRPLIRGLDVGGSDDLQILDSHRVARAFLGDHSGITKPFGAFDDVAGEPAVLHGVDAVLPAGGRVVADRGGRIEELLPRTLVEETGARCGITG